ncbi:MAG: hypothetical protein QOE22_252 [Candidatus Parcubacteria bacterium]|jgi:hypothetical protein|nr:hypothetical protein [Candidatus Parcubacteria bacterium]
MADPVPNTNPQAGSAPQNVPIPQTGGVPSVAESRDMSQFIRTYAKDVAQLTNQPAPVIPKPVAPADDGVMLPETDASPVNRPGGITKEFPQEELTLSKEDSADIFTRAPAPQAAPAVLVRPAPPPQPQAPPTPQPPQPTPPDELERRQAVLARLRAKIASQTPAVPVTSAYVPPPAPPQPAPPAAYVPQQFVPTFSPFAPPAPQPASPQPAQSAPPPLGVVPLDTNQPSPFHSYTTDFANRIDQQQASKFSVLAAQSDAGLRTTTTASTARRGGLIPVVLAVLLIVLGAGGLYAAYRFVSTGEKTEVTLGVPSLIFADEKTELPGPDYRQDLASAASQPLVEGNILITYITVASSTPLGLSNAPQPGGALLRLLDLGAPDILLRNVDLSSTVGVVSAGSQTNPFFILRVSSYERTFAGMLAWESRMAADLELFYPPYPEPQSDPVSVATTTASTTSSLVAAPPVALSAPQGFTDAIVSNIDVRVLKDGHGRTLILYGYSDKETLVIARDEAAFTTLVARLTATRGNE